MKRMERAVAYARVACTCQDPTRTRKGHSIPDQLKLLQDYAGKHEMVVVREFADLGRGVDPGRKGFKEMLAFLRKHKECGVVLVTDISRLSRNLGDFSIFEDLDVEIKSANEGQAAIKASESRQKPVDAMMAIVRRNYIDALIMETKRAMTEKAEQGIYPGGRPPIGYRFSKMLRRVEVEPETAPIIKRVFKLYATGSYSTRKLRDLVRTETGRLVSESQIDRILRNAFYTGLFTWAGKTYKGKHPAIVTRELFTRVQGCMDGKAHSRAGKANSRRRAK